MKVSPTKVQVLLSRPMGPCQLEIYHYSPGSFSPIAAHAHDGYQFGFSPDGGGGFKIGSSWHPTSPGLLHCVLPGVEHATGQRCELVRDAVYFMLYVEPSGLDSLSSEPQSSRPRAARGTQAHGCVSQPVPTFGTKLFSRLTQPTDELSQQEALSQLIEVLNLAPASDTADVTLARKIRDLLLDDLFAPHSMHLIAHQLRIHPATARAVFKHAYGMPPARFRLLKRLHAAREKIAQGAAPAAVAHACGFFDQAHLTRLLKRYYGHGCSLLKMN